ncbi:hypothetical protein BLD44_013920 [Mastigocladus laminosus UU774]|nr:hypothetical protein BLD44_013920 [Mastigocladus laminosus UU774]
MFITGDWGSGTGDRGLGTREGGQGKGDKGELFNKSLPDPRSPIPDPQSPSFNKSDKLIFSELQNLSIQLTCGFKRSIYIGNAIAI